TCNSLYIISKPNYSILDILRILLLEFCLGMINFIVAHWINGFIFGVNEIFSIVCIMTTIMSYYLLSNDVKYAKLADKSYSKLWRVFFRVKSDQFISNTSFYEKMSMSILIYNGILFILYNCLPLLWTIIMTITDITIYTSGIKPHKVPDISNLYDGIIGNIFLALCNILNIFAHISFFISTSCRLVLLSSNFGDYLKDSAIKYDNEIKYHTYPTSVK
ncbi:MAG: hypothetical protein KC414_07645, partial [Romboutsia sp.]|nr:hypothetical protein [Romboutsia sp.]